MKSFICLLTIVMGSLSLQAQYCWVDSLLSDFQLNSTAEGQLRMGDTLIVYGSFSAVLDTSSNQSHSVNRICAFDLKEDSLISWYPAYSGIIYDLHADDNYLYVGGNLSLFDGDTCNGLVRLSRPSLSIDTSWQPRIGGYLRTIESDSQALFVGGYFTQLDDSIRQYLGSIDKSTGAILPWNPQPNAQVLDLTFSSDTLYAGGEFTGVNGYTRDRVARFQPDGSLDAWTPSLIYSYPTARQVRQIEIVNDRVYVITYSYRRYYSGGWYSSSSSFYNEYRLQSIDGEIATNRWRVYGGYSRYRSRYYSRYYYYGNVWFGDMVVVGDSLFIGGSFQSGSNYASRYYMYMHNAQTLNTGLAHDYVNGVNVNGNIHTLETDGDRLFVGGSFNHMGTLTKPKFGVYNLRKPIPVWTGVGDWVDDAATNWSTGTVPVATDSVIIKYGEVTLTDSTTVRSMLLKTNAAVVVAGDSANLSVSQRTRHLAGEMGGENEGTIDLEGDVFDEQHRRILIHGDRVRISGILYLDQQ